MLAVYKENRQLEAGGRVLLGLEIIDARVQP